MNVLIVEDDPQLARNLERTLLQAGYQPRVTFDGVDGLVLAAGDVYDLIVLDVLLPGLDGLAVCRELRRRRVRTPVLMLTARDGVADRVRGLDAGADDYLSKPFAAEELLARLRALSRRGGDTGDGVLRVADLVLDAARHEVHRGDRSIDLTPKEFELLAFLMRHPGQVLTRDQLVSNVWRDNVGASSKMVELYIHYLRNKVDRHTARPLVRTVRGIGYMLEG